MKIVIQYKTKEQQPDRSGWYDTDKGNLFWFNKEDGWSCRDDRISAEYPKYWYIKETEVLDLFKEARDLLVICTLIDKSGLCERMVKRIDKKMEWK